MNGFQIACVTLAYSPFQPKPIGSKSQSSVVLWMKSFFEVLFYLDNHWVGRQDTYIPILHRMIDLGNALLPQAEALDRHSKEISILVLRSNTQTVKYYCSDILKIWNSIRALEEN